MTRVEQIAKQKISCAETRIIQCGPFVTCLDWEKMTKYMWFLWYCSSGHSTSSLQWVNMSRFDMCSIDDAALFYIRKRVCTVDFGIWIFFTCNFFFSWFRVLYRSFGGNEMNICSLCRIAATERCFIRQYAVLRMWNLWNNETAILSY